MDDGSRDKWERRSIAVLLISASLILVTLPFYITFNEFLTSIVKSIGLWWVIDTYISPIIASMTSSILQLMNIKAFVSGSVIYLANPGEGVALYIAWNCIGWQSLVVFSAISYLALRDVDMSRLEKIVMIALGLEGTILVNVVRIALVGLVAVYFGKIQAIVFHDYFGTLISFAWLLGFWYILTWRGGADR
jgi:exosortase/archaeosortase family protein